MDGRTGPAADSLVKRCPPYKAGFGSSVGKSGAWPAPMG